LAELLESATAFKKPRLWQDPAIYYSQGRFLDFSIPKPDLPHDFSSDSCRIELARFDLQAMAAQLEKVKDALEIAVILHRTLIMPKFYWFCDRYWGVQLNCRPPGSSNYSKPFLCPLDHVMIPDALSSGGNGDVLTLGGINFREYSFLDNPGVPKKILANVVEVEADWVVKEKGDSTAQKSGNKDDSGMKAGRRLPL
jgi:arabinosyltransferase